MLEFIIVFGVGLAAAFIVGFIIDKMNLKDSNWFMRGFIISFIIASITTAYILFPISKDKVGEYTVFFVGEEKIIVTNEDATVKKLEAKASRSERKVLKVGDKVLIKKTVIHNRLKKSETLNTYFIEERL